MGKPTVYHVPMQVEEMTADQFRAIRVREGLTQAEFADRIGYHEKSLTRLENSRRRIKPKLIKLVLALFGPGVQRKSRNQPVVGQSGQKQTRR